MTRAKMITKVKLPKDSLRRKLIENLWFVYGNNGKHHTSGNHSYIQRLLDEEKDYKDFYKPDERCLAAVQSIMTAEIYRRTIAKSTKRFNICGRIFQLPNDFEGDHVVAVYQKEPLKMVNVYYMGRPVKYEDIGKMWEV